jgi:hypothetical protein
LLCGDNPANLALVEQLIARRSDEAADGYRCTGIDLAHCSVSAGRDLDGYQPARHPAMAPCASCATIR